MKQITIFFLMCLSLFSSQVLVAQQKEMLTIPRLAEAPKLDGDVFEKVWDQLEGIPLLMLNPNNGIAPSERSEFKIGYTDDHLYFAAFNYDNEPGKIQSKSKKRDEMALNNDWVGLALDSYNDFENALDFSTTPVGLKLDFQIVNDGQGDFPVNQDWNVMWDVETSINDQGWFAEFRIPLSSLRYQVMDGEVVMGLMAFRYIARKSEWDTYPAISNEWGFWSWAKVSSFQKAKISGIKAINPLYFSPYVLAGYQQEYSLNENESAYIRQDSFQRNIGMDIKYGLAKNLTLDLTINTDFAQVEADDQQVNLTRFSLFFPEKRQFFMERSNVFDFVFGGEGRLFYSRTIGLYDGNQVPLWGGGRLTGRLGDWDIGVMSLQTGHLDVDGVRELETTNHSVVRARKKLNLNKNSYAGFMMTSLAGRNGSLDMGYGLDAVLNLQGDTYLNLALAGTYDSQDKHYEHWLDLGRVMMFLERRRFEGLSYVLHYDRSGKSYDPAMGFEFREDFTKIGHHTNWGIIPSETSLLSRLSFGFHGDYFFRNEDQSMETLLVRPSFEMTTKNSTELSFIIPYEVDDVREDFELSDDISIAAGRYQNIGAKLNFNTSSEKAFYTNFELYSGTYYDGWQHSVAVSPNISLGDSWNFSAFYQFVRINFDKTQELYLNHLLRFKTWYMYSTRLSANANIQYFTLDDRFFVNAKIRYNHREGNDFYIVYTDGINSDRSRRLPQLPFSDQRTILLKYTHTFRVR